MLGLIVAYDKKRAIGKDGLVPWDISSEIQRFKELTINNVIIMGRRTYESIGKVLPDRINIVISKTKKYSGENLYFATNLAEAINMFKDRKIFIIGGADLYKQAIDLVDVMYISEMDIEVKNTDTFFPKFDESLFEKRIDKVVKDNPSYTYMTYSRKN